MVYLWFWQSFFVCVWNRLDVSVKTLVFLSFRSHEPNFIARHFFFPKCWFLPTVLLQGVATDLSSNCLANRSDILVPLWCICYSCSVLWSQLISPFLCSHTILRTAESSVFCDTFHSFMKLRVLHLRILWYSLFPFQNSVVPFVDMSGFPLRFY